MANNDDRPGHRFMIGQGDVGALLYEITRGPLLRLDDKRWTLNNTVYSHAIIRRLIDAGWCAVAPEKILDRDLLGLTDAGTDELIAFCLRRAAECAEADSGPGLAVNSAAEMQTGRSLAFDLIEKAVDLDRAKTRELRPGGYLAVHIGDDAFKEVGDWLKEEPSPVRRLARLLGVVTSLAEQAMAGLSMGEMPEAATLAGALAEEAFHRAPDSEWEMDGEE